MKTADVTFMTDTIVNSATFLTLKRVIVTDHKKQYYKKKEKKNVNDQKSCILETICPKDSNNFLFSHSA